MKHINFPLALLTFHLPHLITAQCPACDSYTAALKSCQTTSSNITAVGNTMDTSSVHCMCVSSSSATMMNTCQGCDVESTYVNTSLDILVLLAWYTTCNTDGLFGDQQAVACWEAQPSNYLPCFMNTVGKGSGTTVNGFGVTTTSQASRPPVTAPPSTMAKSDAMLSYNALGMTSTMMIALAVTLVIGA